MTTLYAIIGAVVAALAAFFGSVGLARRSGRELQKAEDARLSAEHEAKVSKAVADELAKGDRSADDIASDWEKHK